MTETTKDTVVDGDAYSCCSPCESSNSAVSQRNADSFTTEESQFRLDTFVKGTLEDEPVSARLGHRTCLEPSSHFRRTLELWVDHFFPNSNRYRRHLLGAWNKGYIVTGPFGGPPRHWLTRTRTEHVQSELLGIGTQFGDY